jgi:hypothetical protein
LERTRVNDPITKIRSSVYKLSLEGVFYYFIFNVTIWLTKSSFKLNFNIHQTQNAMEISSLIWIITEEYIWVIEISSYIIEKSKKKSKIFETPVHVSNIRLQSCQRRKLGQKTSSWHSETHSDRSIFPRHEYSKNIYFDF